jgi:hypothetical protein
VLLRGQRRLGERHDKKASERQSPPPALELRGDLKPAGKELRGRLPSARPSPSLQLATKLASACAAFTTSWSSGARVPLSPGLPSVTSSGGRPLPTSALQTACRSGPRPRLVRSIQMRVRRSVSAPSSPLPRARTRVSAVGGPSRNVCNGTSPSKSSSPCVDVLPCFRTTFAAGSCGCGRTIRLSSRSSATKPRGLPLS